MRPSSYAFAGLSLLLATACHAPASDEVVVGEDSASGAIDDGETAAVDAAASAEDAASNAVDDEEVTSDAATAAPAPAPPPFNAENAIVEAARTSTAAPAAQQFCDLTEAYETPQDCDRFQQQLAAVREGRHAFKPRQPMIRGQVTIVRYAITRLPASVQAGQGTAEEREQAIASADEQLRDEILPEGSDGPVTTGNVQVGRRMYACLGSDPSFTVTPSECQTIDTLQNPQPVWRWAVTPTREGTFGLTLTSGIEVMAANGDVRRIGQFSRTERIRVDVSTAGRRDDFWASLEAWIRSPISAIAALTALIAAIGGLVVGIRKLRGGKAD